jgi:hypothetical protein
MSDIQRSLKFGDNEGLEYKLSKNELSKVVDGLDSISMVVDS